MPNKYLLVKSNLTNLNIPALLRHVQIYGIYLTAHSWCRVPRNWVNLCKVQILRREAPAPFFLRKKINTACAFKCPS
jgi:hypothetical protein